MEERAAADLFDAPQHPYTAALLAARPESRVGERLATIPGTVPSLYERPRGCLFSPRCPYATPRAIDGRPDLRPWKDGAVRCHYPLGDPTREARIAADRQADRETRCVSPLVVAKDLTRIYRIETRRFRQAAGIARGRRRVVFASTPAARWRWSANPAAANRRWRGSSR